MNWRQRNNKRIEELKARRYDPEKEKVEIMEPALYEAASNGNVDKFVDTLQQISEAKELNLETILNQENLSGNSLLHVAARYESKEITELVARHFPSLLTKQNIQCNIPLHVAVRAGNFKATEILVNCAKEFADVGGSLLRIKNHKDNTALHMAVMIMNCQEVHLLVKEDPEVAYWANSKDESPLYLAVQTEDVFFLRILLRAIEADGHPLRKPEGKSPMHAAVELKNLDMLQVTVEIKRELMEYKDEKERNLLHCAASINYVDGCRYLLKEFSHFAREKDKDGLYPIYLACENGQVDLVKMFLKELPDGPDPIEMLNNKGQNILHVAAENGKEDVVRFLIRNPLLKLDVDTLFLDKDHKGNTPLHLATSGAHCFAVWNLLQFKNAPKYLNLKNDEGLTAYDIAKKQTHYESEQKKKTHYESPMKTGYIEKVIDGLITYDIAGKQTEEAFSKNRMGENHMKTGYIEKVIHGLIAYHIAGKQTEEAFSENCTKTGFIKKYMIFVILKLFGGNPNAFIHRRVVPKTLEEEKEDLIQRVNNIMVVAALIAGVAFAGITNMPGGDLCKNSFDGTQDNTYNILQGKVLFFKTTDFDKLLCNLFVFADLLALYSSIVAAYFVFLWMHFGNVQFIYFAARIGSVVLGSSVFWMFLAFSCAVQIIVNRETTVLHHVNIMQWSMVAILLLLSAPITFPFLTFFVPKKWKQWLLIHLSYYIFIFVYFFQKKLPYIFTGYKVRYIYWATKRRRMSTNHRFKDAVWM